MLMRRNQPDTSLVDTVMCLIMDNGELIADDGVGRYRCYNLNWPRELR